MVLDAAPKDCTWEISHGISFSKSTGNRSLSVDHFEEENKSVSPRPVRPYPSGLSKSSGVTCSGKKVPLNEPESKETTNTGEGTSRGNPESSIEAHPAIEFSEESITCPRMPGAFPAGPNNIVTTVAGKQSAAYTTRKAPHDHVSYSKPGSTKSSARSDPSALNILGPLDTRPSRNKSQPGRSSKPSLTSSSVSITSGLWSFLGNLVGGTRTASPPQRRNTEALAAEEGNRSLAKSVDRAILKMEESTEKERSSMKPGTTEDDVSTQKPHDLSKPRITSVPPSHGPKGYRIPDETVVRILDDVKSKEVFWQSSWYRGVNNQKIVVHYCKGLERAEEIAKMFLGDEVLGFDIEWKVHARASDGIRKNVSLVQLANEERVALFHIARFKKGDAIEDLVPPTLKTIMESPDIAKVGVSVKGDSTRLRKYMGIEARGLLELSHMHKLVQYSSGQSVSLDKRLVSLANQAAVHLGLPLWKGEVRSSDWSQDLNHEQVQYAASDSYAGLQIFYTLDAKRLALDTVPPRPAHAELNLPLRLATGDTYVTDDEQSVMTDADSSDSSSEGESATSSRNDLLEDLAQDVSHVSIHANLSPFTPRDSHEASVARIPDN